MIGTQTSSRTIKALSLNARSIRNKIEDLRCVLESEDFDIVAITETFIDTQNIDLASEYHIDNFTFF